MPRHKEIRPAVPPSHEEEKRQIVRCQAADAAVGDDVYVWLFVERHFAWAKVEEAVELCLKGVATIHDPPGRLPRRKASRMLDGVRHRIDIEE